MAHPTPAYRDRANLPMLGTAPPAGPVLLDTNVVINALTGRGPLVLQTLLSNLPQAFVSAVTVAELSWVKGRLNPQHPQTASVVAKVGAALARIDPAKILTPDASQWHAAGERAGLAVRAVAGETRSFKNAADRHELLHDGLTAAIASAAGLTVITEDGDFDLFMQLDPALNVLFYDRP